MSVSTERIIDFPLSTFHIEARRTANNFTNNKQDDLSAKLYETTISSSSTWPEQNESSSPVFVSHLSHYTLALNRSSRLGYISTSC
eukprot:scaffold2384_cov143-Skeletonema_menzelii.AAC.10